MVLWRRGHETEACERSTGITQGMTGFLAPPSLNVNIRLS